MWRIEARMERAPRVMSHLRASGRNRPAEPEMLFSSWKGQRLLLQMGYLEPARPRPPPPPGRSPWLASSSQRDRTWLYWAEVKPSVKGRILIRL